MQEIATFGAGCFWGIEGRVSPRARSFGRGSGLQRRSHGKTPATRMFVRIRPAMPKSYKSLLIRRNSATIQLLNIFWTIHDPTQVNRQGPDYGAQYRTAIFFHSPEQEAAAKKSKQAIEASGKLRRPWPRKLLRRARFGAPRNTTSATWKSAAPPVATFESHEFVGAGLARPSGCPLFAI